MPPATKVTVDSPEMADVAFPDRDRTGPWAVWIRTARPLRAPQRGRR